MDLRRLIQNLGPALVTGRGDTPLADLTDDSRRATPGCCFIARDTGDERWRGFAREAIERGAVAVIAPRPIDAPEGLSVAVAQGIDQAFAGRLAARFFDHPADKLKLIGVTGTNGKTTVATLTQHLLNAAGLKCGLIGTVALDHGSPQGPQPAELTTPGAIDLHRHFAAMVRNGCKACAMEVSSHALDQGRVDGLNFAAAVFTNLTQDHLDYHGTMEAYLVAKSKLFTSLKPHATAVLNAHEPSAHIIAASTDAFIIWTSAADMRSGEVEGVPDFKIVDPRVEQVTVASAELLIGTARGSRIRFWNGDIEQSPVVDVPLVGMHNVSNFLQAVAIARTVGGPDCHPLLNTRALPAVPGRLEVVRIDTPAGTKPPAALVDYAHTPDALENVLAALRPLTPAPGRLIVVFGCGGDRDRTKRPKMAKIAVDLADVAVLTSDNPRTEDPQRILDDALAGLTTRQRENVIVEIDRAAAIRAAILEARAGDTVLIAGKGHEDYQILADASSPTGTRKIHFDDREHAAEALRLWAERHA